MTIKKTLSTFLNCYGKSNANITTSDDNNLITLRKIPKNARVHLKQLHRTSPYFYNLITSVTLFVFGIITIIWTPFNILMNERINMTPGLPPFNWWKEPPDEVLLRIYVFNVTNAEAFLYNNEKLHLEEIGPIIYREKLTHSNVIFNENSTLTYVAKRELVYLPELNSIDLQTNVTIPNWALLGIASYLSDDNFIIRMGFNMLVKSLKSQPFVTLSIENFLWNFTDPLMNTAQKLAPFLVPTKNLGALSRVYMNFTNTVTVYIGPKHTHERFFLIDTYDGTNNLPNYGDQCIDKVTNSTEGVVYPQFIQKHTKLIYWRRTLCKKAILTYYDDVTMYGVKAYKFILANNTFDRTKPEIQDCYRSVPTLPNGVSDIAKCHFNFPLAVSFPHFMNADQHVQKSITGLTPDTHKHGSFLIVEPITGTPMNSRARSQCNLVVRNMNGMTSTVQRFSDLIIPMFWLEYNQVGLPNYISGLVYFQLQILPLLQTMVSCLLLLFGIIHFYLILRV